ncbi:MAG: hypothetical protein ABI273_16785, partial [Lacunisphaera sp.]
MHWLRAGFRLLQCSLICLFVGLPVETIASSAGVPTPMPVISFNQPVYTSGTATNVMPTAANDANPASMWVSNSIPAWIAYDLSSVPVNQRQQVFIAWYANWALG